MDLREAYNILGLPFGASEEEVRRRYYELVKKMHPDAGGNSEEFAKINEAYTTIMNKGQFNEQVNFEFISIDKVLDDFGFDYEITLKCPICGKVWKEKSPIRVEEVIEEFCEDCLKRKLLRLV